MDIQKQLHADLDEQVRWYKANDMLTELCCNGNPGHHAAALLSIAHTAIAQLTELANNGNAEVKRIAETRMQWPVMVTAFKNDRTYLPMLAKIGLGSRIAKTTSSTTVEAPVVWIAMELLQIAERRKRAADDAAFVKRFTAKYRYKSPNEVAYIKALAALPALSRKTLPVWYTIVFKREFDELWPKMRGMKVWHDLAVSKLEYAKDDKLQNHVRHRVKTTLKALLPV